MKNFLEMISKIQKDSDTSDDSDSMDSNNKEECKETIESLYEKIENYKKTGNQSDLEFLNQYSFTQEYHKNLNIQLNKVVLELYENEDYSKLSYLLDEFHRDDNFLDGSILCEMILQSIKDDNYEMLFCLLMADYANIWNTLHIQKAWGFILQNIENQKLNIISKMKESETRGIISDILF